jgi:hypothetical protein
MLKEINWLAVFIENKELSLGRLAFWTCFMLSCVYWVEGNEIPNTLMTTVTMLLTYNLGKKVKDIAHAYVDNKSKQKNE